MPQQHASSTQNNFSQGLKTDFTGLNFPENAATDTDNCVYSLSGEVSRRPGIDFEANYALNEIPRTDLAISLYKWNNVGGDGTTQLIVQQVGSTLYFYKSSASTSVAPVSAQRLAATVSLTPFKVTGADVPDAIECQFTDGNGYLFVFHPNLEPFYCTYNAGTISGSAISLQIRDITGILEVGVSAKERPTSLSAEHTYNLQNQGWSSAPSWSTTSASTITSSVGSKSFTVGAGLVVTLGQVVHVHDTFHGGGHDLNPIDMVGTVTSYGGTTMVINVTSFTDPAGLGSSNSWTITPQNVGLISTWFAAEGNYPSNGDIWWRFKNTSGIFDPATTQPNVTVDAGAAPKGFYILSAFNQNRSAVSGVAGLTSVSTVRRPRTGTWFQGRIWYAGTDGSQAATGDAQYYTWTENIYFSRTVEDVSHFGHAYQNNDPTSEDFFDLLPTDGGVIKIQGAGPIHKLVPVQNGLLVFSENGIWFITGSQGIGFQANDYTVTKISSVQCLSGTSFVDVLGYPMFWNEEGVYHVAPGQQNSLEVTNLCLNTISKYYEDIPLHSKERARGVYSPITFTVSWLFRSSISSTVSEQYEFDRILNFNVSNKAFYPYSISSAVPKVHSVVYIDSPGVLVPPAVKYLVSKDSNAFTFGEERDVTNWVDFFSYDDTGYPYVSYFVTGYNIHGAGQHRWQPNYVFMYSRNDEPTSYRIQGIWNYATSGNSGKYSNIQLVENDNQYLGMVFRRHKIRGQGFVLQYKISSVAGEPFYIIGWSVEERQNASA